MAQKEVEDVELDQQLTLGSPGSQAEQDAVNSILSEAANAEDEEEDVGSFAVDRIMDNVVTEKCRAGYSLEIARFTIWLLDNRPQIIEAGAFATLQVTHQQDLECGNGGRQLLRRQIMKMVKDMSPPNKCASFLNLNNIDHQIFGAYLNACRHTNGNYLKISSYGTKRSALMHLFRLAGEEMDSSTYSKIAVLLAGFKRTIARTDQMHGNRAKCGKDAMSLWVYKMLCEIYLQGGSPENAFAHCFLTMSWSLMARADSASKAHVRHIEWVDDCLIIYFTHSKADQDGINRDEPWHVYANPRDPSVCPILSLGRYLLTFPTILPGNGQLFPGSNQYDRYAKILRTTLENHKQAFESIGVDIDELGTHSVRKGASTFCCSGSTAGPSIVSICLRAGWSMGNVKDRYLKHEKAGDQYCGRLATGIDSMDAEFATSPPYFEWDLHNRTEIEQAITESIDLLCGQDSYVPLRGVATFLLASIYYHRRFLLHGDDGTDPN
jgi:hypothetical protein